MLLKYMNHLASVNNKNFNESDVEEMLHSYLCERLKLFFTQIQIEKRNLNDSLNHLVELLRNNPIEEPTVLKISEEENVHAIRAADKPVRDNVN